MSNLSKITTTTVDIADFIDMASVESDSNHTQFATVSDLFPDNGTQDWWSPSEIHSIEEDLLQIINSPHKCEESITQLEYGMKSVHRCSGDQDAAVNYGHSSGNTNVHLDCDVFMPSSSSSDSEEYQGLRLVLS